MRGRREFHVCADWGWAKGRWSQEKKGGGTGAASQTLNAHVAPVALSLMPK